ncbi:MAG: hypothetical protein ACI8X5_001516 [Planctomycetota bacterium]|jgi:hypothetical protein
MLAFFEGFVNPALVAGVGLASVPLIIHLLNRQRHKPTQWAAMRFVLAAYKQTRRRVQLENLLLLLMRMAAIAILALAVSRPFTGSDGPLSGLTESRRDVAIVIDASASTGYRSEVDSVYERILDRARELVGELNGSRGDRAHLVMGGAWPRLLSWGDPAGALSAISALHEPTDEQFNLAGALSEVLDFAREEAASTNQGRVEIYVLTDLQRNAFVNDFESKDFESKPTLDAEDQVDPGAVGGLFEVLDELTSLGLTVQVEQLSDSSDLPPNLSISNLEIQGTQLSEGAPVEVRVQVDNHGRSTKAAVRVALEVDGVRRPSQVIDIPGQSSVDAIFPLSFDSSGDHVLRALLEGDRLAADDSRTQVVTVPEPVRTLLVNGSPSADFEKDAAARLMVILEPMIGEDAPFAGSSPFAPMEVTVRELESGDIDISEFDLIWLVNVDSVSPETTLLLEEHVAGGAALVFSLGDRVQADVFNARFYKSDGSALSPAELSRNVAVASRRQGYYRIKEFDDEHPALALFAEKRWRSLLTEAPFYEFIFATALDDAKVLARIDDASSSPLFIERQYDRGRVYLWTSSMDESWTALPTWGPTLVPFVYDFVRSAGTPPQISKTLAPGQPFVAEVRSFPRQIELVLPGDTRRSIDSEAVEVDGKRWLLPTIEGQDTARAGLYRLKTEGAGELSFAVQVPRRESQLARLTKLELEDLHGSLKLHLLGEETQEQDGLPPRRGELWRGLAFAVLLLLIVESLWSSWIGRRRKYA